MTATDQTTELTPTLLHEIWMTRQKQDKRQINDVATSASYDALNRLTSQSAGGLLAFKGTLSEPASVTVQNRPVTVDSSNSFSAAVPAPSGTTTVVIAATDPSGNRTTATYEVDQSTGATTFAYDANGNLVADGTRTFEWDARNQLVGVNIGSHRTEFEYNGDQRRVS